MRYGDLVAVDDVSFTAAAGEVTAVLGPNGAGKTSTIEVCEGYRRPTAARCACSASTRRASSAGSATRMGVMLQEGGVYPERRRVGDGPPLLRAVRQRGADATALVEAVGLADRADGDLASAVAAASGSACRWPSPSPPGPTSRSSTSRRPASTSTGATRSARSSATSPPAAARWCWPPTSSTRPSGSPTAW